MLSFDNLNVNDEIKNVLKQFRIDFVFQPIFNRSGDVMAVEALMRPEGSNILAFIDEMTAAGKLHELELVSFFGATMAYRQRGYDVALGVNSFPSECFTVEEAKAYSDCFKPIKDKLVIEILEYTEGEGWIWKSKHRHTKVYDGIRVALDDFGTGNNDVEAVKYYNPHTVKLDRSLISDINLHKDKQQNVADYVSWLHDMQVRVLAEGVETKEEYDYLYNLGVDLFQGYYLVRPA